MQAQSRPQITLRRKAYNFNALGKSTRTACAVPGGGGGGVHPRTHPDIRRRKRGHQGREAKGGPQHKERAVGATKGDHVPTGDQRGHSVTQCCGKEHKATSTGGRFTICMHDAHRGDELKPGATRQLHQPQATAPASTTHKGTPIFHKAGSDFENEQRCVRRQSVCSTPIVTESLCPSTPLTPTYRSQTVTTPTHTHTAVPTATLEQPAVPSEQPQPTPTHLAQRSHRPS